MVERYVRDVEAAGSNPVTSTKNPRDGIAVPRIFRFKFADAEPLQLPKMQSRQLNCFALDDALKWGVLRRKARFVNLVTSTIRVSATDFVADTFSLFCSLIPCHDCNLAVLHSWRVFLRYHKDFLILFKAAKLLFEQKFLQSWSAFSLLSPPQILRGDRCFFGHPFVAFLRRSLCCHLDNLCLDPQYQLSEKFFTLGFGLGVDIMLFPFSVGHFRTVTAFPWCV